MTEYYCLKNTNTKEILYYKEDDFLPIFKGTFEHIIANFCLKMYMEKNIEIPKEKRQTIFFMDFVTNWNENKKQWSDLEAISYYDLPTEEQQKIANSSNYENIQDNIQENKEEKQRNQKNKSVGNGEGSLYYSETLKCWVFQYYEPSGKRKTIKQLKKETVKHFKDRVSEIKVSINNGTYIEKSEETVKIIISKHIKQKFNDGITKGNSYSRDKETLQQIEKCCSNFINKPIQNVTLNDIQTAKENMKKYAPSGINRMWRLLKKAFAIASSPSARLITFNIMNDENLKKPIAEKKTKKIKPLTLSEREKLSHILDNEEKDHEYRNIVKMEWLTGMRIGEVLARSSDDVLENKSKFHIHNTLTKDEHGNTILGEHTKTYNKETEIDEGEREFPIFTELRKIIDEQLSKKITNIYGLLFWDYNNMPKHFSTK